MTLQGVNAENKFTKTWLYIVCFNLTVLGSSVLSKELKMTTDDIRELLTYVGKDKKSTYIEEDNDHPNYHSIYNCGFDLVLEIEEEKAYCKLHNLKVCQCGWEFGFHYGIHNNKIDERIRKLWNRGVKEPKQIAWRIGQPNIEGFRRVREGLKRLRFTK